jgi:hypothetical protein
MVKSYKKNRREGGRFFYFLFFMEGRNGGRKGNEMQVM